MTAGSGGGAARRSGRRPGHSGTREAIAAAARRQFAEHGLDRTSLRSVAAEAGVDPALVTHYFGSKAGLFVAVTDLPVEIGAVLPQLVSGPREDVGRAVAAMVVARLADPHYRQVMLGVVRSAATDAAAADTVRDLLTQRVLGPVAQALALDRPDVRVALAGSQVVGLVMARHVVGLPPLPDLPPEDLVTLLTPVFAHWFTGDLGLPGPAS